MIGKSRILLLCLALFGAAALGIVISVLSAGLAIDRVLDDRSRTALEAALAQIGGILLVLAAGCAGLFAKLHHLPQALAVESAQNRRLAECLSRSEERFRLAVAATNDGIWDWDLITGEIWFSARWKEHFGYRDDELPNSLEMWSSLIFEEDRVAALKLVEDYNAGRVERFEAVQRFHHKDGHIVYIHSRAIHVVEDDGRVVRMVGSHSDITERMLAEQALRAGKSRFRDLAETIPGMIYQWYERSDGHRGYRYVSPRSKTLFGIEPEALIADWTLLDVHPDDRARWRESIEATLAGQTDWEFEGRLILPSGAVRWVEAMFRPIRENAGELIYNGILFDVTEQKRIEAEAANLRERLDFLLNASPSVIYACRPDGNFAATFCSDGIRELGYTPDDLVADPSWWIEHLHPDDRNGVLDGLKRLPATGRHEHSYRLRHADGSWRWIIDRVCVIRDDAGRPVELIGAMIDVTAIKTAQEELGRTQQKLRAVLDAIPDLMLQLDADGQLADFHAPAAAEAFMLVAATQGLNAIIPMERAGSLIEEVRTTGTTQILEYEGIGIAGPRSQNEARIAPLSDGGALIMLRDITDRKRAERVAGDQLSFLRTLLDTIPHPIYYTNPKGVYLGCNKTFGDIVGVDPEAIPGQTAFQFFPPELACAYYAGDADLLESGGSQTLEAQVLHGDGTEHTVLFSKAVFTNADSSPGGVVGVMMDISERKRHELELARAHERLHRQARELADVADELGIQRDRAEQRSLEVAVKSRELERSNAELEQFAYVASHDLRQPLRTVSNYVSLLERRYAAKLDDDAREFIAFARDGARRMDQLIVDLLEYSRIGRKERPMVPVSLDQIVSHAVLNLQAAIEDGGATVSTADGLPMVVGSEIELTRLFQNLVGNALKYRDPLRPPVVMVEAEAGDGEWVFTVRDNGIGIAPEHFDRIFGIFQRLHGKEEYEGTGIGLAVCKKIVERHKGRIWVESTPGQGSAFRFTLPGPDSPLSELP
jgi:PAS domain S-box-containing protein